MKLTFTSHTPVVAPVAGYALDPVARIHIGVVDVTDENDQAP